MVTELVDLCVFLIPKFFKSKKCKNLVENRMFDQNRYLDHQKGLPGSRRSLQLSRENIQLFKREIFFQDHVTQHQLRSAKGDNLDLELKKALLSFTSYGWYTKSKYY